jgi:hypothetical protein
MMTQRKSLTDLSRARITVSWTAKFLRRSSPSPPSRPSARLERSGRSRNPHETLAPPRAPTLSLSAAFSCPLLRPWLTNGLRWCLVDADRGTPPGSKCFAVNPSRSASANCRVAWSLLRLSMRKVGALWPNPRPAPFSREVLSGFQCWPHDPHNACVSHCCRSGSRIHRAGGECSVPQPSYRRARR